jgi:Domain of unknown function (DUF4365)
LRSASSSLTMRAVAATCLEFSRWGWPFREQPVTDVGIDALVEEAGGGNLSGRLIALIIKAGTAYFAEPVAGGWLFRGTNAQLMYWVGHSLPVVILVHHPGTEVTYWAHVTSDAVLYTREGWKILIPSAQVLGPGARWAFTAISSSTSGKGRWLTAGLTLARAEATTAKPAAQPAPEDFPSWVGSLVERFRRAVEDRDLWRALWDAKLTRPRGEKVIHIIAGEMWRALCESADVDISREANAGRGAVDFKFSAGWHRRALIEVKLLSSSRLRQGARDQLPQYLASEQVSCAYYMCVGFRDRDLLPERLELIRGICASYQEQSGMLVVPEFIDARPKAPASRLKD